MSAQFGDTAECPSCGEQAEPEQDGDVQYFACWCGFEFGYSVVKEEETCAAGFSLTHLATLNGLTSAETDRLVYGGKPPQSESAVFLGSLIPVRPEDN